MLMRLFYTFIAALLVFALPAPRLHAQDLVASTEPLTAQEQLTRFHLPPGFEIQLVAAEPEIRKPINLNFDAAGRLYATQSEEYPFPAEGASNPRDVVKVFSGFDASGKATEVTTYADGLNIPIGVLPVHGGALVYSIPAIRFAPDSNGDGKADELRELYREFGFRDTHGMASSFTPWVDGWVYACHGFANDSQVRGADGKAIQMNSGNTFRMRRDGSHVEQFTWGQVNPFGLAFDPLGNLYSSDCHTLPVYMLLRGARYPSFGKPHDGLGYGPEMISHNHGSTGIAGVVYYTADHFPNDYSDTIFIGNPVTGRINHDKLEAHGSTYRAVEQPDFLRCDDPWFRPVDIKLGPDGALYVADFYNRIIGHYEVPLTHPGRDRERGRIWRIVYKGDGGLAPRAPTETDLTKASVDDLVAGLAHANLVVRIMAVDQLVERCGAECVDAVRTAVASTDKAATRAFGLWVLERLGKLNGDLIARLSSDPDRLVRVHAIKTLGERANWSTDGAKPADLVRAALNDEDAFVRRAAADALGRHPAHENIRPLLQLWARTPADDTHLIHVARMALRDQLLVPGVYKQIGELTALGPADRARLADVSLGVPNSSAALWLLEYLSGGEAREGFVPLLQHAARHAPKQQLAAVYSYALRRQKSPRDEQIQILQTLHQSLEQRGVPLPGELRGWAVRLAPELVRDAQEPAARAGIELARQLRLNEVHRELVAATQHNAQHAALRGLAMDAAVSVNAAESVESLTSVLRDDQAIELRQKAASLLGGINSDESRSALVSQLALVPERLAVEIAAALSATPTGGEVLLKAAGEGKVSPRLLLEKTVQERLIGTNLPNIEQRITALTADLPPIDDRLTTLIVDRKGGYSSAKPDTDRGRQVFAKTCAACHRLGGEGSKIGPELDGVGVRGLDRLLEDVLDPNRNVDQAFRTTQILTIDGRVITGLLLREEGETLVLSDNQGKEVRVAKADVDEQRVSNLSPMPANVADLVPEDSFYDLIAFLLSQKQAAGNQH